MAPINPTNPSPVATAEGSGANTKVHNAKNTHRSVETDTKTM